jgi:hypothetical protein
MLTADRIRSMLECCKTDKQVLSVLKAHKVKFTHTPYSDGYALNIRIPCKTGTVRVYRCCSRRSPYIVQHLTPCRMVYSGIPVFRPGIPEGSPYNGI